MKNNNDRDNERQSPDQRFNNPYLFLIFLLYKILLNISTVLA